jgi:hypothetical protein
MIHNGQWFFLRYAKTNVTNLLAQNPNNTPLINLIIFLETILDQNIIPTQLFGGDNAIRVSSVKRHIEYPVISKTPGRYTHFVTKALSTKEKLHPHTKVQKLMLAKCPNVIATEVPVWCNQFYRTDWKPCTGHIDFITFEEGKIWIWDYKGSPEKTAADQITFYRDLLCTLVLGLEPKHIEVGWFDKKHEEVVIDPPVELVFED